MAMAVFIVVNSEYKGNFIPWIRRMFSKSVQIRFRGKKLVLNEGAHIPTRDSLFMFKNLEDKGLKGDALEIGTGCGALPVLLDNKEMSWMCTEIHEKVLENARLNFRLHNIRAETVLSDVFDDVKGEYDFIIWNFPFIYGSQQIMRKFIHGLPSHLKESGTAYLLSSQIMKKRYPDFDKDCEAQGIRSRIIARGRYFLVPIWLYELEPVEVKRPA
jgi:hypothetical protein